MLNEYQPIKVLVKEIKGTTGALSYLITKMSGVVILFVVLGVLVSQIMFN
jgi:hypothetical protein